MLKDEHYSIKHHVITSTQHKRSHSILVCASGHGCLASSPSHGMPSVRWASVSLLVIGSEC